MASRKPQPKTRREWEDADLAWRCGETEYRVLILSDKEYAPLHSSTNYDHCSQGPGVLIVQQDAMQTRTIERDLHDRATWDWIGRLMRDGLGLYGQHAMITPTDQTREEVEQAVAAR